MSAFSFGLLLLQPRQTEALWGYTEAGDRRLQWHLRHISIWITGGGASSTSLVPLLNPVFSFFGAFPRIYIFPPFSPFAFAYSQLRPFADCSFSFHIFHDLCRTLFYSDPFERTMSRIAEDFTELHCIKSSGFVAPWILRIDIVMRHFVSPLTCVQKSNV